MKIEWISVIDRLPEIKEIPQYESGLDGIIRPLGIPAMRRSADVLVLDDEENIAILSLTLDGWEAPSFVGGWDYELYFGVISHWAELPNGPV